MMRKAFSFLAVVALAFAAQAETTTWQNSFYTDGTPVNRPAPHEGETFANQRVFVVYGSLTIDDLWSYKDASATGAHVDAGLSSYIAEWQFDENGVGPVDDGWGGGVSFKSVDSENAPAYRLLMFDTVYKENARRYFLSEEFSPTYLDEGIDVSDYIAAAGDAGKWQPLAVPEPTSGLLFLFGLAGLALKRRRG